MRAIILAAGTGSRLGGVTTKALIEVNGIKLIDYLLKFLNKELFTDIYIVGGYHFTDLANYIETKNDRKISVLQNSDYLKGNIYTLIKALTKFNNDSFLLTNVDHIYPPIMFNKMEKNFNNITAMCDFDRNLGSDDMKVRLRPNTNQIEAISKKLETYSCGYIGMTFVHKNFFAQYTKATYATIENIGDNAVVENILQTLSNNFLTAPYICDLSNFGWYEVDNKEDLEYAEKALKTNKNFI